MLSKSVSAEITRIVSITTFAGALLSAARIAEELARRFPGDGSADQILDAFVRAAVRRDDARLASKSDCVCTDDSAADALIIGRLAS
jgi:hypothetical protein